MNDLSDVRRLDGETIRVVFVWDYMYRGADGVKRVLLQALDGLPQFGIDPYVVALKGSGDGRDALHDRYPGRIIECNGLWPGPDWHPTGTADGGGLPRRLYHNAVQIPSHRFQWARFHYDVLGTISALRPNVVVFIHAWHFDLSVLLNQFSATVGIWASEGASASAHHSLRRYGPNLDAIVGVSPGTGQNLAAASDPQLSNKVMAITQGIDSVEDIIFNRSDTTDRPLQIAYVGRFQEKEKRISDVPKTISGLVERGTQVEVSLVGEGPDYERICQEVRATGVTVRCPGPVPPEMVAKVFSEHDAMLLTSESEGGPQVLLEAIANGCVPVVSRCPSGLIPLLVEEGVNGLTFEIGDVEGAAGQLAKLSMDRALLGRMSVAAMDTSKAYPLEQTHRQYADLFWELSNLPKKRWSKWSYRLAQAKQLRVLSRAM